MPGRRHDLLLLSGAAVLPTAVAAYVAATAFDPDHDFIAATVSKMAVPGRPQGAAIGIGLVVVGMLVVVFAHGVRRALGNGKANRLAHFALSAAGLLVVAGTFFPDDPVNAVRRSTTGWAHDVIFSTVVGCVVVGVVGISIASWRRGDRRIARGTSAAVTVLLVAEGVLRGGTGFADGLLERIAAFVFVAWISLVAWHLERNRSGGTRSGPSRRRPTVLFGR